MELEAIKQAIQSAALDTNLTPDPFFPLDELLQAADDEGVLPLVLNLTEASVLGDRVHPAHHYLYAGAQFRLDRADAAYRALLPLASRLEAGASWNALGMLSIRALDADPRVEAALHLAKAFENAGIEAFEPVSLQEAYENFPGESRLAHLMGELRAKESERVSGDDKKRLMMEARFFWAESLDGFIGHKKGDAIEDVLAKLVDTDNRDTLRRVLAGLKKMADSAQWGRYQSGVEILSDAFDRVGLLPDLWRQLLTYVGQAPASVGIRTKLFELADRAFPHSDGLKETLQKTGILDPDTPVDASMRALEPLLAFLPGSYILHSSWGVGRVLGNDGENLMIDFAEASSHRMSVNLARRALQPVPSDDLRVQLRERPEALKALVRDNPADVVYLGIRQLGTQAKTTDLKRVLTAGPMSASKWTTWWKDAKASLEGDTRFDLSQAFRQVYKIRSGVDPTAGIDFPIIEPRRGIRPNLNLIRRFLDQHPKETGRAATLYSRILERWAREEKTNPEDRMAIHLQLYRWRKETNAEFLDAMRGMLSQGVEASSFPDETDQLLLAREGLVNRDTWKDGVCFCLSSRHAAVRELAITKLRSEPETGASLLREVIQAPADRPLAALAIIHLSVRASEADREVFPAVWDSALGAAHLIESTSREQVRKLALTMLVPEGGLAAKLAQTTPSDSVKEQWGFLLRKWRSSQRYLQPILRILRQAGLEHVVEDYRTEQVEKTNRLLVTQEAVDYSGVFMTRTTFDRLRRELETMNYELRTTVAQAIAKARAHGDLRENAEYDAARQKQGDYMERIGSLTTRLQSARMIDDLKLPDNEIGPGTYIELEQMGTGEMHRYWLLGEGDDPLGAEVLSYASPLGRELLGKKIGSHITVLAADGAHELVVKSIVRKLPKESETASPA